MIGGASHMAQMKLNLVWQEWMKERFWKFLNDGFQEHNCTETNGVVDNGWHVCSGSDRTRVSNEAVRRNQWIMLILCNWNVPTPFVCATVEGWANEKNNLYTIMRGYEKS